MFDQVWVFQIVKATKLIVSQPISHTSARGESGGVAGRGVGVAGRGGVSQITERGDTTVSSLLLEQVPDYNNYLLLY